MHTAKPLVFAEKHSSGDTTETYTPIHMHAHMSPALTLKSIPPCAHKHKYIFNLGEFLHKVLDQFVIGFCSLLSSFVCISVCCAESPASPLCTCWSLLASYPRNISVFVGRLRGGILAMPQDLSRELQIIQRVFVYEKKRKRENSCASLFVSILLFIYTSACVSVYFPLCSF